MSTLSAQQRGDLAEQMLPVAAHLAVLVHGDGGPEDVREVLEGLDETAKSALIVVLAGLVDPEQPVGKALGWLDFNEHGALTVPSWSERSSVRDLAPEPTEDTDDDYVDPIAVLRFVQGVRVEGLTDAEFLTGVQQCVARGKTLGDLNAMQGWPRKTAENWVNRLRKQYQRSGRVFPSLAQPTARTFTEAEVVSIRERSAGGAADQDIAMSYGVTRETVRAICRGQRYPQYGGPVRATRSHPAQASREFMHGHSEKSKAAKPRGWKDPVLTTQQRTVIGERLEDGEGVKQLAAEFQVSSNTIRRCA